MTDERLREIAKKHARQAVCPTNRLSGDRPDAIELQNMVRAEEIIFYALKEAFAVPEGKPITDNDKRWRILEHGCQWVSWTPIGGETHSFDPRDVGHLKQMRAWADETIAKQLAQLDEARRRFEAAHPSTLAASEPKP